jgi:UDP-glucuronate 4-epimerase
MKYLVTGAAGFIGFHLTKRLLKKGETVVGIDNLNNYYDVRLKHARLNELGIVQTEFGYNKIVASTKFSNFQFIKIDIADKTTLSKLFENESFDIVFNFAAQAGIMYSTINPNAYIQSNIVGFITVLECCKEHKSKLIYASSSSVYGNNAKVPFSETDSVTVPKNLYAKTKIQNEQLAQIYSDHFGLQAIGLRLFSVYGTFGRPDMGYMIFTKAFLNKQPINIYGNAKRDYTFVEDAVTAILKLKDYYTDRQANNNIFNVGSENPISLLELIEKFETELDTNAIKNFLPARAEEIESTFADCSKLKNCIDYKLDTSLDKGISEFVQWYKMHAIIK